MVSRKNNKPQVEELRAQPTLDVSERHKRDDQLNTRPPIENLERVCGRDEQQLKKIKSSPQNASNNNIPSKEELIKFDYMVICNPNILRGEKIAKTVSIIIKRIEESKKPPAVNEAKKSSNFQNLKKVMGVRFVKYLNGETVEKLPTGDNLDNLNEWNSLFDMSTPDETSDKKPLNLMFINQLKFDIPVIKRISSFIEFISNFNPKEFDKSPNIKEKNTKVYKESCVPLIIAGKFLREILKKIQDEITYFQIEKWSEKRVEFKVSIGTGDQKEIRDKIKDCVDLNTTYSYNSNEPQVMPFKYKCEGEAEELKKEETKKGEGTRDVSLTVAHNLSIDKNIAENSDSAPNKASELLPSQTNERLEKEPTNLFEDPRVGSDYYRDQVFDSGESPDFYNGNAETNDNSKYKDDANAEFIDNLWA